MTKLLLVDWARGKLRRDTVVDLSVYVVSKLEGCLACGQEEDIEEGLGSMWIILCRPLADFLLSCCLQLSDLTQKPILAWQHIYLVKEQALAFEIHKLPLLFLVS